MYACQPDLNLASLKWIPAAFSAAAEAGGQRTVTRSGAAGLKGRVMRSVATPAVRTWLRHHLVPLSLPAGAGRLAAHILSIQPDLVHAMRIPYEGMLAALAYDQLGVNRPPLLVSVWGNDFSLHAPTTRRMAALTHKTLGTADGLHTDCGKDQHLAYQWGFGINKPAVILPGAGGIQLEIFFPPKEQPGLVVINPRGLRSYVRNDTFFQAIPSVLRRYPETRFICPAMAGQPEAERWVSRLGIGSAVDLLPRQRRDDMATLYRQARVVVSPSTHDGTPNTLLEAMACGCTPVAGDIESLREWITPGVNGLLVDPGDPRVLADAICTALEDVELQNRARAHNLELIRTQAAYIPVMQKATEFSKRLVSSGTTHNF
jgi:glycosyltransferase involved in cell wall biosynthesis